LPHILPQLLPYAIPAWLDANAETTVRDVLQSRVVSSNIFFGWWDQGYVDDQLLATGFVTKAVIMGLDGSTWAISSNFAVRHYPDLLSSGKRLRRWSERISDSQPPRFCSRCPVTVPIRLKCVTDCACFCVRLKGYMSKDFPLPFFWPVIFRQHRTPAPSLFTCSRLISPEMSSIIPSFWNSQSCDVAL
jgi:hypothetical protein